MKIIFNYFGIALFVALLGINVYSSLENPMLFASEEALAQTSSNGCQTQSCGTACPEDPSKPLYGHTEVFSFPECCRYIEIILLPDGPHEYEVIRTHAIRSCENYGIFSDKCYLCK